VQKGSFKYKVGPDGTRKRMATEWRLTNHGDNTAPDAYHQLNGTKEFMRWPEIQNTMPSTTPLVPLVKPYGATGETRSTKYVENGATGDTVKTKMVG
jgi:hypothetical protein